MRYKINYGVLLYVCYTIVLPCFPKLIIVLQLVKRYNTTIQDQISISKTQKDDKKMW